MRRLLWAAMVLLIAACSSAPTITAPPTQALITAAPTITPLPLTPSPTLPPAFAPAELGGSVTPTPILTPDPLLAVDPVAADLVALAQRQLAQALDLPMRRIRLVDITAVRWTDNSLGCPAPRQTPIPLEAPGYRIVLEAGEQWYIYHSDIERVIPCDAAREVLPGGTPTATASATLTRTPTSTP